MTDQTTTWMGHTLTHEFLAVMIHKGLNPWLTVLSGQEVRLAKNDWRGENGSASKGNLQAKERSV